MIIKLIAMIAAFSAGACIAFQSPINAKLGTFMGGNLVAAFCSFFIGTVFLGLLLLITKQYPDFSQIPRTQLWMWVGGCMGAMLVFTTISTVPILGSALMVSLIVCGQVVSALIIDKTGFLLPQSFDISWQRLLGIALVMAGVTLIAMTRPAS